MCVSGTVGKILSAHSSSGESKEKGRGIPKKQGPPLGESSERLNVLTSALMWTLESNTMALSDLWPLGSRKAELPLVDTIMVLLIPSIINDILCQDSLLCFSRQIRLPSLVCFFPIYAGRWWIILRAATLTAITRQKLPIWPIWPTSWTAHQGMLWCTAGYHRHSTSGEPGPTGIMVTNWGDTSSLRVWEQASERTGALFLQGQKPSDVKRSQ